MEELQIGDWVKLTSVSRHHSGSKNYNPSMSFNREDIGKLYQIKDIETGINDSQDSVGYFIGNTIVRRAAFERINSNEILNFLEIY